MKPFFNAISSFLTMRWGLILCLLVNISFAAKIKNIQRGTLSILSGTSTNVTIDAVTLNKSFLIFSYSTNHNEPQSNFVRGYLSSTTNINFSTVLAPTTTDPIYLNWQVYEFESGVTVERGTGTYGSGNTSENITITSVDSNKTFSTFSYTNTGSIVGSDDYLSHRITAPTTLRVQRNVSGSAPVYAYQIISFDDAYVQSFTKAVGAGDTKVYQVLGTAVDKSKSMVISSHTISGDINPEDFIQAELISSDSVMFTKWTAGLTSNVDGYVVEFNDGTEVLHHKIVWASGNRTATSKIPAVDYSRSGIIGPSHSFSQGISANNTDDNFGYAWARLGLVGPTKVEAYRTATGYDANIAIQIVSFGRQENLSLWKYSSDISINTTSSYANVTATVENFPLLIRLGNTNFPFEQAQSAGEDIRFSLPDGTPLPHEIESWSAASQYAYIWVLVPQINRLDITYIRMYWGNSSALDRQKPTDVWSSDNGFAGVWHMNEEPFSTTIKDRTSNNLDGTASGFEAASTATGVIGSAVDFDGTDEYFTLPSIYSDFTTKGVTVCSWSYHDANASYSRIIDWGNGTNTDNLVLSTNGTTSTAEWSLRNGGTNTLLQAATHFVTGGWVHTCATWDASTNMYVYKNGTQTASKTDAAAGALSRVYRTTNYIGESNWAADAFFDGRMDELQVSTVPRSASWAKLAYENTKTGQTMISFNIEDYANWKYNGQIQINTTSTGANITDDIKLFPILVKLNSSNFNFGQAQSSGQDIRFALENGTALPYEIERWSSSSELAEIWVLVPEIKGNDYTSLQMYWGNSAASSRSDGTKVFGPHNGYIAVYHLAEDAGNTADGFKDATIMGSHGTGYNFENTDDATAAIGIGLDFDGTNEYINLPGGGEDEIDLDNKSFTVSFWAKRDVIDVGHYIISQGPQSNNNHLHIGFRSTNIYTMAYWFDDLNTGSAITSTDWNYWTNTYNNGSKGRKVYQNGAINSLNVATGNFTGTGAMDIGRQTVSNDQYFNGMLDEIRISNVERSAAWVELEYDTQVSGQSTVSIITEDYNRWTYKTAVKVNTTSSHANVSGNVENFPLLVRLTGSNFDFSEAQNSGEDIRFALPNGVQLPYEIERWDNSSELAEIWVLLPIVFGNSITEFYMYWGNSSASDRSNGPGVFGFQNGYGAVYHMSEDPNGDAGSAIEDHSGNSHHGTPGGSMTTADLVTGLVGQAIDFDGSNDYIDLANMDENYSNGYTLCGWSYFDAFNSSSRVADCAQGQDNDNIKLENKTTTSDLRFTQYNGGTGNDLDIASFWATGEWIYACGVYDGDATMSVYKNGSLSSSTSSGVQKPGHVLRDQCYIARSNWGSDGYFDGKHDEITFHTTPRSADWIKLSYETQKYNQLAVDFDVEDYSHWSYSQTVQLNTTSSGANVSGDVENFPVLLKLTHQNFDFSQANSSGDDLRFSLPGGKHLPYEIELWDSSNKTAAVWVLMPVVYGNSVTELEMYWGNSAAEAKSSPQTVFSRNNGFRGAYHFSEAANTTTDGYADATGNGFDGTGTSMTEAYVDGVSGKAQSFDGTDDFILMNVGLTVQSNHPRTVSIWAKVNAFDNGGLWNMGTNTNTYEFSLRTTTNSNEFRVEHYGTYYDRTLTNALDNWRHYVMTYDGTTMRFYYEGTEDYNATPTINTSASSDGVKVGKWSWTPDQFLDGQLDEFRVSTVARSANWIKLEYENQKSSQSLVTYFDEDYADWSYTKALTLNTTSSGANIANDVSNFPVLIRLTSTNFDFSEANSSGNDIRFSLPDGTHLPYELESWDNANELAELWVLVPKVKGNSKNKIHMYWGNDGVSSKSDPAAVFNTDNGFSAVWHMSEASGTLYDATGNSNDGTASGGPTYAATGIIGKAISFDDTDDYFTVTDDGSLDFGYGDFTASVWINMDNFTNVAQIFKKGNGNTGIFQHQIGTTSQQLGSVDDPDNSSVNLTGAATLSSGRWEFLTFQRKNGTVYLYNNGIVQASTLAGALNVSGNQNLYIGSDNGTTEYFAGDMDELIISKSPRSTDWIRLSYENQKSNQSLVEHDEEDYSSWSYSSKIQINTTSSGANVANNVYNFPLLVSLDQSNFSFNQAMENGEDIRFQLADGTHLNYEIERWDNSANEAVIWVLIPIIYGNSFMEFTMFWGKTGATDKSNGTAVFNSSNNFVGVWHLNDESYYDASDNQNNGTDYVSSTSTTGIIGRGRGFDGTDDYVSIAKAKNLNIRKNITLSGWFYADTWGDGEAIISKGSSYGPYGLRLSTTGGNGIKFSANQQSPPGMGSAADYNSNNVSMSTSTWYHVAATYNGDSLKLYINGVSDDSSAVSNTFGLEDNILALGADFAGTDEYFDGNLDEVRLSNAARSGDWIRLEYENQKASNSLVSVITEDYNDWTYSTKIYMNTTSSGANVSGDVENIPLLVRLNNKNFDFSQAMTNGEDIRFSNANGIHLPYEIERWDNGSELAEIWVLVPKVLGNNKTQYFKMYWGKSASTDRSSGSKVFDVNNNFTAVYHLNEDGNTTADGYADATSHQYHGTGVSLDNTSDTTAIIGNGTRLDGTADWINLAGYNLTQGASAITLSGWVKTRDLSVINSIYEFSIYNGGASSGTSRAYLTITTTGQLNRGARSTDNGSAQSAVSTPILDTDVWYYITAVINLAADQITTYTDGTQFSSSSVSFETDNYDKTPCASASMGSNDEGTSTYFDGYLDELRVEKTVRSANWIKLSYENQRKNQSLLKVDYENYSDWTYSQEIILNTTSTGANVSGDVENFPVLVRLTSSNFTFSQALTNGEDIRFADNLGNKLNYEIERWDNGGQVAEIWVNVPIVYGNAFTHLHMFWGKSDAVSQSSGANTFDVSNGFKAVWHLDEDGNSTANGYSDATDKEFHGTGVSMTNASDISSMVGFGQDFDGSADYITSRDMLMDVRDDELTLSGWINLDNFTGTKTAIYTGQFGESEIQINNSTAIVDFRVKGSDASWYTASSSSGISADTWYHVTGTWVKNDNVRFYLNGALINSTAIGDIFLDDPGSSNVTTLGAQNAGAGQLLDGTLDEMRIATTARDANWIKLEYENQRSSQTLVEIDPEDYSGWKFNQRLRLNTTESGANVSDDVYHFPLLIKLTNKNFEFTETMSNGEDIRFSSATGRHLPYEIERWDNTNELAEIWVLVDTVYGNNNSQYVNMYWGKSSETSKSNGNAVFSENNDYVATWHLSNSLLDATPNGNDGTDYTTTNLTSSIIGRGRSFDGNDRIDMGNGSSIKDITSEITVSTWIKTSQSSGGNYSVLRHNNHYTPLRISSTSGEFNHIVWNTSQVSSAYNWDNVLDDNSWHHYVAQYSSASGEKIYIDGKLTYSNTDNTGDLSSSADESFMLGATAAGSEYFIGSLDEVRIANDFRSEAYIKLSYENQKADQSLLEMTSSPAEYAKAARFTFNTTGTGANVSGDVDNFPLFLRIDSTMVDFSITKENGSDILFVDSSGAYLPHEIVEWNRGNSTGKIWVKIPRVEGNDNTDFVDMYYGCEECNNPLANGSLVFNGYAGVYHLNGESRTGEDASGNAANANLYMNLALVSGITTPYTPTFNGTSDRIKTGTNSISSSRSISAWINPQSSDDVTFIESVVDADTSGEYGTGFGLDNGDFKVILDNEFWSTGQAATMDSWQLATLTFDASNAYFYVNGAQVATHSYTQGSISSQTYQIGKSNPNAEYFNGYINEVQIYEGIQSADFVKLSYETQKENSAFTSTDDVCGPVPAPGLSLWLRGDRGVSTTGSTVNSWADTECSGPTLTSSGSPVYNATAGPLSTPVVRLDGTNDYLEATTANLNAQDIFVVTFYDNTGSNANIATLISNGADGQQIRRHDTNESYRNNANGDANDFTNNGTSGTGYVDGEETDSFTYNKWHIVNAFRTSQTTYTDFMVGSYDGVGRFWDGDVAEILVYDRKLDNGERNLVLQYLRDRYGFNPPKNNTTLTATAKSSSVKLSWTKPVSITPIADTVGIWARTDTYPDSSRNGILVGYFDLNDSSYTWPVKYPGTWYFSLQVRDSEGKWSNTTDNAQDSAIVLGGGRTKKYVMNTNAISVTSDITDFPMLVRLTSADAGVFAACANVDGSHLRFIDDNDADTLDFEVERWDSTNALAEIWVKIPTVDGNSTTDYFTMWYDGCGNEDITNATAVFDPDDNFTAVWHLNEDAGNSTDGFLDVTGNENHGTGTNLENTDDVSAIIGVGLSIDGVDEYVDMKSIGIGGTDSRTISGWVKGTETTDWATVFGFSPNEDVTNQYFDFETESSTYTIHTYNWDANATASSNDDSWHYLTASYDGTNVRLYEDGALVSTTARSLNTIDRFSIGRRQYNSAFFDGVLDEIRAENTVRSADWIKLSYESQQSGSSFLTPTIEQAIYVNNTIGSDSYTCGEAENPSTPKATVTSAVACPIANGADTVKVLVAPGTYTDSAFVNGSHAILITAMDPKTPPVFNGRLVASTATLYINQKIHIRNLDIKANTNGDYGIVIEGNTGNDSISVVGCRIYNNGGTKHSIGIYENSIMSDQVLIANNIIHGATTHGIRSATDNNNIMTQNIIYGYTTTGISLTGATVTNISVTNNMIVYADTGITSVNATDIGLLSNNLFHNVAVEVDGHSDGDPNSVSADPLIVSTSTGSPNYMKLAPGSPAIDAGTDSIETGGYNLSSNHDYWGTARPVGSARDIGVYEGTGYSEVFTGEIDTLTVSSTASTVTISTNNWKIVFNETHGGGIAEFYDGDDLGTNLLTTNIPLLDLTLNTDVMSEKNGYNPSILSKNRVHTAVKQLVDLNATYSAEIIYHVYASGHIYVQSKITNNSGSDGTDETLEYKMELSTSYANEHYHNLGSYNGFGYLGTSTRDVYFGVTKALNIMGNTTWAGDSTDNTIVYNTQAGGHLDLDAAMSVNHYFLIYIGSEDLDKDKGTNIYADSYNPSTLTMNAGTSFGEQSWQDNIKLQLAFDEGGGTTGQDLSYNSNSATITGASYTSGVKGTGLNLTGSSDYATIADADALEASYHRTYMIWIKRPDSWTSSGSDATFFSKGSGWSLKRVSGTNQVQATIGGATLTDAGSIASDSWVHLALTTVDTKAYFYVNGILRETAEGLTYASNSNNVIIGYTGTANTQFAGQIDDARIYDSYFQEDDILAIYNLGFSQHSGRYRLRANNNNRVIALMNPTTGATRFQPILQVDNWYGGAIPKYVYVDGVQMRPFIDYVSVLEPKLVNNINMGNSLELQFNKTFTEKNVDIFIDNDDSTGFLGASALMPTLEISSTAGDEISIQNFSGSVFGEEDDNQWQLVVDLNASSATTTGDGGINSWKTSAINPKTAVSSADDLTGSDSTTLDMLAMDDIGSSGSNAAAATLTYTVKDSSAVRYRIEMASTAITGSDPDYSITRTYTFYPTGQIFFNTQFTSISSNITNPQISLEGFQDISKSKDAWSSQIAKSKTRMGKLSQATSQDFHGFGVALLGLEESGGTDITPASLLSKVILSKNAAKMNLNSSYFQAADPTFNLNYMVDISRNFSDSAQLDTLLTSPQSPASMVARVGSPYTSDAMDFNGDGFAEGEGSYVYTASNGVAHFRLNLSAPIAYPSFKIRNWNSSALPEIVIVENQEQIRGYHYNAAVLGATDELLIQFNKTFAKTTVNQESAINIYIALKTSLAVTMHDSDFVAISAVGADSLKWTTQSEFNNLGFYIKRRAKPAQEAEVAPKDTQWVRLSKRIIPGAEGGRSASPQNYVYVDKTAKYGIIYEYMLVAVDFNGMEQEFGPREASPIPPLETKLFGNYPNPFNPVTTIRFDLKEKTKLTLNIYNMKGQLVRQLITPQKPLEAGKYRYNWDAKDDRGVEVPSGHYIYFFLTQKGSYKKAMKMTLLK